MANDIQEEWKVTSETVFGGDSVRETGAGLVRCEKYEATHIVGLNPSPGFNPRGIVGIAGGTVKVYRKPDVVKE